MGKVAVTKVQASQGADGEREGEVDSAELVGVPEVDQSREVHDYLGNDPDEERNDGADDTWDRQPVKEVLADKLVNKEQSNLTEDRRDEQRCRDDGAEGARERLGEELSPRHQQHAGERPDPLPEPIWDVTVRVRSDLAAALVDIEVVGYEGGDEGACDHRRG